MSVLSIPTRLAILTMLMLIAFFAGCARADLPRPQAPVSYRQEKIKAVDHWRDVAVDVADKIRDALVARSDIAMKPIFVMPPDSRPFMLAFHEVVKSELVSRAIQVSEAQEPDGVTVEYSVLTVRFDGSRRGFFSSASDNEVVVTVRMAYDNRYVVHQAYIRYINDPDWMLYLNTESVNPGSGGTRTIRVTGR